MVDNFVRNLFDVVKNNGYVSAVIIKIDYTRMSLEISTKPSDFKKYNNERKANRDQYFDEASEETDLQKATDKSKEVTRVGRQ